MKSPWCAVALVWIVGVPASAESTKADWVRKPTPAEFQSLYPKAASASRAEASVLLSCTVGTDGALKRCTAKSSAPDQYGFEAAAVQMSQYFQMRPATVDGVSVESQARVPINFKAPAPGIEQLYGKHWAALAGARKPCLTQKWEKAEALVRCLQDADTYTWSRVSLQPETRRMLSQTRGTMLTSAQEYDRKAISMTALAQRFDSADARMARIVAGNPKTIPASRSVDWGGTIANVLGQAIGAALIR